MKSNKSSLSNDESLMSIVITSVVVFVVIRLALWLLGVEVHALVTGFVAGVIIVCAIPFLPKKRAAKSPVTHLS